ncbi:MAG: hypothetical protein AAGJ50_02975 [Pseudomonadota bacterium]
METLTDADMVRRVLEYIHVAEAGEPLDADDQRITLEKLKDVVAEGRTRGLVYWSTDETPRDCVTAMEQIVGARVCGRFLRPEFEAFEQSGWRRLSQMVAEPYRDRPVRASHI